MISKPNIIVYCNHFCDNVSSSKMSDCDMPNVELITLKYWLFLANLKWKGLLQQPSQSPKLRNCGQAFWKSCILFRRWKLLCSLLLLHLHFLISHRIVTISSNWLFIFGGLVLFSFFFSLKISYKWQKIFSLIWLLFQSLMLPEHSHNISRIKTQLNHKKHLLKLQGKSILTIK